MDNQALIANSRLFLVNMPGLLERFLNMFRSSIMYNVDTYLDNIYHLLQVGLGREVHQHTQAARTDRGGADFEGGKIM